MRTIKAELCLMLGVVFMLAGVLAIDFNIAGFGILFSIGTVFVGIAVYLSTKN